jgi:signal transduction histidine kinase
LRILHLEDEELDTELVREALLAGGVAVEAICRVDTRAEFEASLARPFDLILADWRLPSFDGLEAMAMARARRPDLPFIMVSGKMGEEAAIESLKAGATDYVLKRQFSRLPSAVTRAVQEAEERARLRRAEREREELLARERAARAEAERAGRMKDRFLATLSHELRTPLTPVLTTAQVMERDPALPARYREPLALIRRNVELEARVIDDLLDLTGISRGRIACSFATVDLHEQLRHVVRSCDADVRSKGLGLSVYLEASVHLVRADGARLQQALWNLLRNAVKFTPAGGRIAIRTVNRDDRILVAMEDTGVGLEPEAVPRIFEIFEQGDQEVARQFGGLGLGLAIAKEIVAAHGGALTARSEGRGKGATFTLELATTSAAPARTSPADLEQPRGSGEAPRGGGRLLLVEDNEDTAAVMSMLLESFGFQVRVAGTVALALKAVEAEPFDLIISDIALPDGSGLDLMKQIQLSRPVKGIAMSGYGMEEDVTRSLAAGFSAHLTKPVSLPVLEDALRQVRRPQDPTGISPTAAERRI